MKGTFHSCAPARNGPEQLVASLEHPLGNVEVNASSKRIGLIFRL
jgi:hypothetical protein